MGPHDTLNEHEPEAAAPAQDSRRPPIDRSRYRRVRRFFLRTLLHALWWDVVMVRPGLRRLRPPALERWRRIARSYRDLAVELGGVMIKLGQFLSSRVDVLPPEITDELAALQDEVPPEDHRAVVAQIEADFGCPLGELFSRFDDQPMGAASLAQVHAARTVDGDEVVVKALRPGIEVLVETDLAAFAQATRWLRLWRGVRQRVDVAWLEREFRTVTRSELDLVAEGRNAERFAQDFADDPGVVVPRIFWAHTATRTLTMENVAAIKVGDPAAIAAAGIDRRQVAKRLYGLYMRQFFVTHFVHADPHPGNIFIHPADTGDGASGGSSEAREQGFRVAFVDFGMMTEIPERLRQALRQFAIGLGTRDARRIVDSYAAAGTLLPGADLDRLVAAHQAVLDRFWGIPLAELRDAALGEAPRMMVEFRDLLLQAPIQLQADMLFAMRAVGLLAGLATRLDHDFDPWAETIPYAKSFAREEQLGRGLAWLEQLGRGLQALVRLPAQVDRLLDRAERGKLGIQTSFSPDSRRLLGRLERAVDRLSWTVAAAALLVSGVLLHTAGDIRISRWLLGAAAAAAGIGMLRRRRGAIR